MMLMAMRLQKAQVSPIIRFTTPGAASFQRAAAIMAGYTSYQALVIGAAGGRSGVSGPWTDQYGTQYRYGGGGGGGSSKLISGLLSDLAASTAIAVGALGTFGGNGNPGGAGGRGGNSTFGALATGYGGFGAPSEPSSSGPVGWGGSGANPDGSAGPAGGHEGWAYAVAGSWNAGTLEGSGGGGGYGDGTEDQGQGGAAGAGSGYSAPGESYQGSPNVNAYGGGGGGCNAAPLTGGAAEYYGTGWNTGHGNGAVIIKLS